MMRSPVHVKNCHQSLLEEMVKTISQKFVVPNHVELECNDEFTADLI